MIKKKDGFEGQQAIIIPVTIIAKFIEPQSVIRQLYITDIGYYPNAKHHFRRRQHGAQQHILIYCVYGKGALNINKQSYVLSPGEFVLIPGGTPHEYNADTANPWTIYWMHFKGSLSNDLVQMMLTKMKSYKSDLPQKESRIQLFDEIYYTLERGYSMDNIYYANLCLGHFLASCTFNTNYNNEAPTNLTDNIEKSIEYMQQHLNQIITIQEIASAVNLSASHLGALFKKQTGFSLIDYFNQLKIQKACQYLQFTKMRINEIGQELGIEDPYYFTRMFTKIMGESPKSYRRKKGTYQS